MSLVAIKRNMMTFNNKAVTILEPLACIIIANNYNFIMLGYNSNAKLEISSFISIKHIYIIKINLANEFGSILNTSIINYSPCLDIKGKTKGKGFSGVMKRYGFAGLGASHGVSLSHRSAGAIGACQDPGRVWKGKKMAGRMGGINYTVKNIKIAFINRFTYRIAIYGSLPGNNANVLKFKL